MTLDDFFKDNPRVALGLSGGTDSAYLLYAGLKAGADIYPFFVKTPFQPQFELCDALRLSKELKVRLNVIELNLLSDDTILSNTGERCYHCKSAIFGALKKEAKKLKIPLLIDGTNASDDLSDRPGTRALRELCVRSPLLECGLAKDDVRRLSKDAGLFTWNKPAYACLATRIPEGTKITADLLRRVEYAENELYALGYQDIRVRVAGAAAKLQLKEADLPRAAKEARKLCDALSPYFDTVLLDLKGR